MEWVDIRLGDACTKIGSGATPRGGGSVYLDEGPIAFIRSQNVYNEGFSKVGMVYLDEKLAQGLANVQVEELDVLLNITGDSVARACQVKKEALPARVNQHVAIIRTDQKKLWPTYLRYFLVSPTMQAHMLGLAAVGATRNALTKGMIESFSIRCPKKIDDQKAIAKILSSLDDKIDLNRRINQTLEAMAQAIFKSWFVDFDPVKAKIDAIEQGQDPLRAAMRAISGKTDAELDQIPREHHDQLAATAVLFPDAMQESELGEIPSGWKVVPASALIEFNPKEPLRKGTVAPYLDMASLPTSGSWAESPVPREFGSGMRFRNGDALLARITPCLENGKSAFVQNLPDESVGWGSTEFIVMRSKKPVPQEYAYLLARHAAFREHTIRSMTGTSGRQRAQVDTVAEFKVISPSESSVWCAFSELLGSCFKAIKSQSEASETLAELRDTLLPKLLSGNLSVADSEMKRVGK